MRTSVPTWAQARFAALRAIRELAESSDKDIWRLLSSADEIRLPAGACVAQAERYSTELIVVIEGTLRATSSEAANRLGPGDSLGWVAMQDRTFNEATVVAESDVRLLVIGHAQFRAFKAVAAQQPPTRIGAAHLVDQLRGLPFRPTAKLTVSTAVTPDQTTYSNLHHHVLNSSEPSVKVV